MAAVGHCGAGRSVAVGAFLLWGGPDTLNAQTCREPTPLRFEIASKIERSELGFTQGLEVRDGQLYESTGRVDGTTRLNVISLTGQVRTLTDLGTTVFGEGLTILNDEVYQLTWQDHQVFVYDLAGKRKRAMRNPREGWGLTNDGSSLIFSDGGPAFYYVDPQTFAVRRTVKIRTNRPGDIVGLNELELVRRAPLRQHLHHLEHRAHRPGERMHRGRRRHARAARPDVRPTRRRRSTSTAATTCSTASRMTAPAVRST